MGECVYCVLYARQSLNHQYNTKLSSSNTIFHKKKRYMMIDAYDSFNQRGNDSALGRHLEASFKYIKHVLIPHSKRRDRYYQDVHADAVANAAAIATGQSSKLRVAVSSPPSPKTAKMKLYHHRTQQRNQPLLVGRSISKRNLEISWETPASVPECDEKEESSDELSLSSSTSTSEVTSAKSSFADEAGSTGVVMQSRSKSVPANFAVAANVYNKSSSNNTNTNNEKKNAVRDSSTGSHSGRATF